MQLTESLRAPKQDEIVVIKLWEIYLLYHPANLYKVLTDLSMDNGPSDDHSLNGRVVFRFARKNWEEEIKNLLYEFRIPIVIQSNPLHAVKVKGRMPALR